MTRTLALAVGLAIALAATARAAAIGTHPSDFEARWQDALAELAVLPPDALDADHPGTVSFPVTDLAQASAAWFPGADADATPVVHVVTAPHEARPPERRRSHLYLEAPDAGSPGAWSSRHDANHEPTRSVLAACQAVALVRSRPGATASRVGLVGDGFGASIALAAAALAPDRVAWLVLHQPRPALTGTPTDAAWMDPLSFAPLVRCPAFMTVGGADRDAPRDETEALFAALTCPRDGRVLDRLGHCPSADLPDLAVILARMDRFAEGWRATRVTSP